MGMTDQTDDLQARIRPSTLLFVHIPKTAGTTFQSILRKLYSEPDRCELYPSWWVAKKGLELRPKREPFRAVGGHFTYGVHTKPEIRPFLEDDIHYVTFLRDPVDRIVSTFNHLINSDFPEHRAIITKHPTLEEYLKHKSARNAQTWFITGWRKTPIRRAPNAAVRAAIDLIRDRFKVVGITERFDESLVLFAKTFGWDLPTYVPENLASSRERRLHIDDLDDSLIERIRDINRCDIAIYEYAISMFDAKFSEDSRLRSALLEYRSRLTGARRFLKSA